MPTRSKSSTTTDFAKPPLLEVSPGEVLREDFLAPLGLQARDLAARLGVKTHVVLELVEGKRAVDAALAVALGREFDMAPEFWLNLQRNYEGAKAKRLGRAAS